MPSHQARKDEALRLLEAGNRCHQEEDIEGAIENYRRSIDLYPTAEGHTFLGWMYSFQGRLDAAIAECRRAIEVDPEFGNPYNDIGAYLIQQGRLDEAVPWLERAMTAERYEPRHFPHVNLGRIHLLRREYGKALGEFRQALRLVPGDPAAAHLFRELVGKLN